LENVEVVVTFSCPTKVGDYDSITQMVVCLICIVQVVRVTNVLRG